MSDDSGMRAVRFHVTVPGYLTARSLGRISESAVFGRLSGVRMEEVARPRIPGPGWVRLRVLLAGICGSDIGNVTYTSSPAMEPFASFPAVLGHEILAEVEEAGPDVTRVRVGQRVVVDPMLSCVARGYAAPCPSCAVGRHSTCERAGDEAPLRVQGEPLSPGLTVGYHRDLPGGWGPEMVAHESQLFPVPDEIDDRAAVLTEPLAIGMHAARGCRLPADGPVLVIGSGPIAFGTIWALRGIGFEGTVVAQTKRPHEARLARLLGASGVVRPGDEARQAMVETGASAYQPLVGPEVFEGGGFPLIFDCVGSEGSLNQALRYASPRGRVVLLGCAGELKKPDLTFLWARELEVKGFVGYGREHDGRHTFEHTLERLRTTGEAVQRMVTHVFPLSEYRDGLSAAHDHRKSGAVKVLLQPES